MKVDKKNIAILTGTALQDDETYKYESGFIPERDQYYFELLQGDNSFLLGFKDMLICLRLLEQMKEIPAINTKWWQKMAGLYGDDLLMVHCEENVP